MPTDACRISDRRSGHYSPPAWLQGVEPHVVGCHILSSAPRNDAERIVGPVVRKNWPAGAGGGFWGVFGHHQPFFVGQFINFPAFAKVLFAQMQARRPHPTIGNTAAGEVFRSRRSFLEPRDDFIAGLGPRRNLSAPSAHQG